MLDPLSKHGPEALARRLYVMHSEALLAFYTMHRLSNADAVDLLQQTFVELLATLTRNPELEIRHPRAFLFKIAVRQLGAWLRKARRHPVVELDTSLDTATLAAETADLERLAGMRAEQRLMLRALRHLPTLGEAGADGSESTSVDQLILYLRFWAGLTLAEIAEILGMTPAAVSGRLRRGLQRLRRSMEALESSDAGLSPTSTATLRQWHGELERAARASERERDDSDEE